MKKKSMTLVSVLMALAIAFCAAVPSFAEKAVFDNGAYETIITASDIQAYDRSAFELFDRIVSNVKKEGVPTPGSVLFGGDYSRFLPDYATPGIYNVKRSIVKSFPEVNPNSVLCIQGNHDFLSSGFIPTGLYDMGSYNLYAINENDFPWNQFLRIPTFIKSLASDVESSLSGLIEKGDKRPVIILTHVPLHHTERTFSGDNMYSSYLFNVINKAAEQLDIIFLFGHNHSGNHDDYIGGSINFFKPGDTIRVPLADKMGKDCYTEEKLNFVYTNCGYVGYSDNGTENGSTNVLSIGVIQFTKDNFRFVKYSEQGVERVDVVDRLNANDTVNEITGFPKILSEFFWNIETEIIKLFAA